MVRLIIEVFLVLASMMQFHLCRTGIFFVLAFYNSFVYFPVFFFFEFGQKRISSKLDNPHAVIDHVPAEM